MLLFHLPAGPSTDSSSSDRKFLSRDNICIINLCNRPDSGSRIVCVCVLVPSDLLVVVKIEWTALQKKGERMLTDEIVLFVRLLGTLLGILF